MFFRAGPGNRSRFDSVASSEVRSRHHHQHHQQQHAEGDDDKPSPFHPLAPVTPATLRQLERQQLQLEQQQQQGREQSRPWEQKAGSVKRMTSVEMLHRQGEEPLAISAQRRKIQKRSEETDQVCCGIFRRWGGGGAGAGVFLYVLFFAFGIFSSSIFDVYIYSVGW